LLRFIGFFCFFTLNFLAMSFHFSPKLDSSFSLEGSIYKSDTFWDSKGKKRPAYQTFKKKKLLFCLKQYVNPHTLLQIKGAYARIEETLDGRTIGLEDGEISLFHSFGNIAKCTKIFGGITLIIPFQRTYKPGLRYGRFGMEGGGGLCYQTSCQKIPTTFSLYSGYRLYEGFPSDQIRSAVSMSCFLHKHLQITGALFSEYGFWNGSQRIDQSHFLFNPNYRLLKGVLRLDLPLYFGCAAHAEYAEHLLGRNVGRHGQFSLGLSWDF